MSNNSRKQNVTNARMEKVKTAILARTSQEKSFLEKNLWLKQLLAVIAGPVVLYSVLTGGIFLYSYFLQTTNNPLLSKIAAGFFVATVEGLFYWSLYAAIEDVFDGDYRRSGHYTNAFLIKMTLALSAGFCSVYWSLNGAPETADFLTRTRSPIVLEVEQPINDRYDALIAVENENIETARTITWKNKCVTPCQKLIAQSNANKERLETDRKAEIAALRGRNDVAKIEYESKIEKRGNWFQGFAGGSQFIGFLIVLFFHVFDHGVKEEEESNQTGKSPTPSQNRSFSSSFIGGQSRSALPTQRTNIGFKMPWLKTGSKAVQAVQQSPPPSVQKTVPKTAQTLSGQGLDSSGASVQDNSMDSSQRQKDHRGGQVVKIGEDLFWPHQKTDGTIKNYTKEECINFANKYHRRAEETRKEIIKLRQQGKEKTILAKQKVLAKRIDGRDYWLTAAKSFEG